MEQDKVKLTTEIPELFDFMLLDNFSYNEADVSKILRKDGINNLLIDLYSRFEAIKDFTNEKIEQACRKYSEEKDIKTSAIFHPLRVATSGRTKGPSLFHYL